MREMKRKASELNVFRQTAAAHTHKLCLKRVDTFDALLK